MRRKLNLRVLACLVVGLLLLAGGVHWLHGRQVQRNAGALLEQADRAEEQGDLAGTVDYLRRYVSLARDDAPGLARLGLLMDRQASAYRERLKAFFVIEQALRIGPDQHDVRRQLARIALDLWRHSDAHAHLDTLLKSFPNDAELEDLQGQCAVGAARFGEAESWWEKAVRHAPGRVDCWGRRGFLLRRRLNRPEDADRVMDEMIAANPQSAAAFLARGRFRAEFHGNDQGAADLTRALQLAPGDADVLLAAADLEQSRNQLAGARAYLEHGIQKHPRDGRFLLSMARLEIRAGQRGRAVDCLRQTLPLLTDAAARWTAADLFLDAREPAEARAVLDLLEKGRVSRSRIDYLRARLQIGEQQWGPARNLLEGARQGLANAPALLKQAHLLLALCYQHLGNPDLRLAACRAALAVDPAWEPARLALASATAATGRLDEAIGLYEKLATQTLSSRLAAGRLLFRRTLRLPAERRNWAELERFLNEAPESIRTNVEWQLIQADILVARGRLEDAEKYLEAARSEQPSAVELRVAQAALADRRKHADRACELLDEAERELGDRVDLRLARAARGLQGPKEKINNLLVQLAGKADHFSKVERARLLDGLILGALRADDVALARQLADRLVQLHPHDANSRFLAFRLALQARDAEGGRRLVSELRRAEGDQGALWRYGEAALWARFARADDKSGIATARSQLAEAAKVRPSWAPIALLDAELCEREGNVDQAIERYREAVLRGERQVPVVRRVVQLLHERRRYAEAEELLRHLQEGAPLAGSLGRLAAEVSLLGRRTPENTLELAQQAVAAGSTDYREQLWLGQILAALDRRPEAEKAFRRAVELKPDVADTWVNLVLFLARGKQTEAGEAALRDAQKKLASEAATLPLAICWEALDQREKAAELYQEALKSRPNDPEVLRTAAIFRLRSGQAAEAQPLLRKLLAANVPAGLAAWARRNLAIGLAMTGGHPQFKEALALVDENLKKPGSGVEDQRARALVLAAQPGHRRESIRLLEDSFTRLPASSDEQFLLARLHEMDRNWSRARACLLELLTATEGKNPLHLAYFVAALVHHDDLETAEHWLERLEKREPNTWRTIEVKARLRARQGRGQEAVRLIEGYDPGQNAGTILSAARLLEGLGQGEAAEKMYGLYGKVATRPETALVRAEFLARCGRVEEALTVAEKAAPKCPPEIFAVFCGGVVRAKGISVVQRQRVDRWLKAALAKQPKSLPVLLAFAQLRDAQERYSDAQTLYRKVLAVDPKNVMAANNLAVLLALNQKAPEAVELSRNAIDLAGPLAPLLDTRGTAYLSAGQTERAVGDLEEAVAQQPTAPRYYHLARAYRAAKNRGAAQLAYQKAKKLGLNAGSLHPLERADYEKARVESFGDASGKDR